MDSRTRLLVILAAVAVILIACICVCAAVGLYLAEGYASDILTATAEAGYPPPVLGTPVPEGAAPPAAPDQGAPAPRQGQPAPAPAPPAGQSLMTPEDQAYRDGFLDQAQRWMESRTRFNDLNANRRPDDPGWTSETVGQLAAWRGLASQVRDLQPSPRFAAMHQKYLEAAQHFDSAADAMTQALNGNDMAAFDAAKPEIAAGDSALGDATNMLAAGQ